ncbi:hypothetical protein GCM10008904_19770 [Paraclostridium ghonii]|uniref:LPXTG-motif cell wall-anchored protein n=1 Tax=Paraclostridium ghonii TaxID=29358 RepID=A0ABU0MXI9_9FIRM|nr:LPXTG cell wall anchor domain-containing protein [Paeniclostridium ghonii]MDQ0555231.1 LPXTG-motif cell wall-anchored protein [Paeniclostridium ghonii]
MKRYFSTFILIISFLLILTLNGYAIQKAPSNVILEGNVDGIITFPEKKFLECLNMMPGDKEYGVIDISSSHDKPFELYLRAERVTDKEEHDLLEKIDLKVTYKDKILYEGPVSGANGLEEDIYLGTFNKNESAKLLAEVELDGPGTTSEYQGKIFQVDWIFTALAQGEEKPDKPTNLDDKNNLGSSADTSVTEDNYNNTVGVFGSPKTGDNSILIYIGLFLISLILIIINRKKK